jgi:hypothetical protein
MARKPTPKPDDPEQSKRFIQAAVEAEAAETENAADKAFKAVVKPRKPK